VGIMLKQATKEALILIVTAVAIALAVTAIRPDKIGINSISINQDVARQSLVEKGFSEISIADARRLHEEQGAIFADARHAADFAAGHIQAAVNLYAGDPDVWLPDFLAATDPATVIVTYCDGEDCHLAPALAELLFFNGFDHVRYLQNGWTRWREGGFPVELSNAGD
jgi:rhodanese-related sulfurtransferase